jgi:hypothetical protein
MTLEGGETGRDVGEGVAGEILPDTEVGLDGRTRFD